MKKKILILTGSVGALVALHRFGSAIGEHAIDRCHRMMGRASERADVKGAIASQGGTPSSKCA